MAKNPGNKEKKGKKRVQDRGGPVMIECGGCYQEYDVKKYNRCPVCDSEKLVGMR